MASKNRTCCMYVATDLQHVQRAGNVQVVERMSIHKSYEHTHTHTAWLLLNISRRGRFWQLHQRHHGDHHRPHEGHVPGRERRQQWTGEAGHGNRDHEHLSLRDRL